jgi:hypothetical protein
MASIVNAERSRLQNEYAPLRLKILEHYQAVAQLTGGDAGAEAHRLPRKLGQWHHAHSERVHAACPELSDTIDAIENLAAQRDWQYIRGRHKRQRPGPKPGQQRRGPLNTQHLHQSGGVYRGGYEE